MPRRDTSDLIKRKTDQARYFDHKRLRDTAASGALGKFLTYRDFIDVINGGVLQFDSGGNVVGCQTCPIVSSNGGGGGGGGGGGVGGIPIWAAAFYSVALVGSASASRSIITDSDDNVYITGFYNTGLASNAYIVNSNQSLTTSNLFPLTNGNAMYMLKFNSDGIFKFAVAFDGQTDYDRANKIKVGSDGSIYIAGIYGGTSNNIKVYSSNFTSQTSNVLPTDRGGLGSGFLIKYNSAGAFQYACAVSGLARTTVDGLDIDSANNPYISGIYRGDTSNLVFYNSNQTLGTSNVVLTKAINNAAYLAKFNSFGQYQYVCTATPSDVSSSLVALHPNGNQSLLINYTTSNTTPILIKDAVPNTINQSIAAGVATVIFHFSNDGSYISNINQNFVPSSVVSGTINTNDIYIDNSSNTYVTGQYRTSETNSVRVYSPYPSVVFSNILPSSVYNNSGSFAIKFNSSGVFEHATAILNPSESIIIGNGITADSAGNYYVTGYYNGSNGSNNTYIVNSNNTSSNNNYLPSTSGISGAYIVKYNSSGICQFANALDSLSNITYYDQGSSIAIDSQNNILVTGMYGDNNGNNQTSNNIFIYGSNQSSITRNILPTVVGTAGGSFIIKFPN